MENIKITIAERIAVADADAHIVCGNSDYQIKFIFDADWTGVTAKTARFFCNGVYTDVVFSGDKVTAPPIINSDYVEIGVYAENLTTTPARIPCRRSIKCRFGSVLAPSQSVYDQIITLINNSGLVGADGVSVTNASINASGHLMITLSSGESIDCGIAKGADGTGVTILGNYESYAALIAAHPSGTPGDAYIVQGNLYVWSATSSDWIDVGNIQGPAGAQGAKGEKGDKGDTGAKGADGNDGFSPTATVVKSGSNATITITDKNGTTSAVISDGSSGSGGSGVDGYSPIANVSKSGKVATITITDKTGTTTATVSDGADGQNGDKGATFIPEVNPDGDLSWSNNKGLNNPSTVNIKGPKGDTGANGAKGDTGANATINGVNALTIAAGEGLESEQSGNVFTLKATNICASNAGAHNSIYRGKNIGTNVTAAQWAAIGAGTFDDMYIGDFWVISGVTYRIAAFDYYYKTGDTSCETHHVTLVPDGNMYTHAMNDTNVTTGAYVGSKMYTMGLSAAKTTINNAFGSAHILTHRQYLQNAVTDGYTSAGGWYDSTVELMTEQNVYGCKVFGNCINGTAFPNNYTVDKTQYPLFRYRPDMISIRQWFWLRDVASEEFFCRVSSNGPADCYNASDDSGVRPAFSIM